MKMKIRRLPYFLAFFVTGFSLLLGLSLTNITKDVRSVSAEDKYYSLAGNMNGWSNNDSNFKFTYVSEEEYRYEGLLDGGKAGVEFKVITEEGMWDGALGFNKLADGTLEHFGGEGDGNILILAKNTGITISVNPNDNTITATLANPTYLDIVGASKEGVNLDRMRIWLHRGIFQVGIEINALQFGPAGTVDDDTTIIEASGYVEFMDGDWLAYFDIPITDLTDGMDIRVVRASGDRKLIWNKTVFYTWQEGDNNRLLYVGNTWENTTLTSGIIGDDKKIPVTFTKYVLEGYLTCSDSEINGYGAFPEMNRTFFKDADDEWKIVGVSDEVAELGDIIIDDYADKDLAYTGGRVNTVTGWDKYTRMEMMYQASINGSSTFTQLELFTNKQSVTMVLVISLVGLTSLFGLHFLKKRKTI